ncbi:MAG: hypothetical protein Q8P03_00735 [bacterium]|nr:hypothetical protein [bacterium]
MFSTREQHAFYKLFYGLLRQFRQHLISQEQFFHRLKRGDDFATTILLDIETDFGFSEWVRLKRTARGKLRFETGQEGGLGYGIIFWVGLNGYGKLRITKTEKHGWVGKPFGQIERRKVAKATLKAIMKIVPPRDD